MSKQIEPPLSCFWGSAYQDSNGTWHCPSATGYDPNNAIMQAYTGRPLTNTVYVQTPALASTVPTNTIMNWIKLHPYVVLGGVGLFLWIFFFKGRLNASSKVRTDITRWGL